jgi:hypothetical protein
MCYARFLFAPPAFRPSFHWLFILFLLDFSFHMLPLPSVLPAWLAALAFCAALPG